jgi:hypothetical protein
MGEKPELLYKYTDLFVLQIILRDQTLKFSSPSEFNDPFDCDVDMIDFDFTGEINPLVANDISILKQQFKMKLLFPNKADDPLFWQEAYKGGQLMKVKSCRICCFSLKKDIILMWSHYGDKHMGVCLEFNNKLSDKFINLTDEDITEGVVGYTAHERINYISEDRSYAIYKLFMNKSESWRHEEEYRLILINNKPEIQKFNPKFLASIYFGLKVSDDQIRAILNGVDLSLFKHLKYYRGVKGNLKVEFSPFEL